ncbi:hypothetical protein [Shewanella waksmanii]|uniref:hypothetical protein n=1 Tax=Shewanella waksmanii TaxID=213783 RepID=UPI0037368AED
MSSVIELLEQMGQNAALQNQTGFEQAINDSDLNPNLKTSLLNRDDIRLKRELDVCPDVVCAMIPAEDDEATDSGKDEDSNDSKDSKDTQSS